VNTFRSLRNPGWPVRIIITAVFCLACVTEIYREPAGIFKTPAAPSVFLRGTLYREEVTPSIIGRMLAEENSGIEPLVPDIVDFIRDHPVNLESKWALNVLNRNFVFENKKMEAPFLDEILRLSDPIFVVLNVDEEMKIWLLQMMQRYMGSPGLADKKRVFVSILTYAPYLVRRSLTRRVKDQAVDALRTFAENADLGILACLFDASFDLLKNEYIPYELRLKLEDALRRVSFRSVTNLRADHLERRSSDEVIAAKLTAMAGNDPVKLYAYFTDHWVYGTLADEIFSRLEAQAQQAGHDLYHFLEQLDPLKHFFESFLFSSINFSKSGIWFRTEDTVYRSFHYMFNEISTESLTANAALTQIFIERLLAGEGPYMNRQCKELLLNEYKSSRGFRRYFIAATIILHRVWFDSLDDRSIEKMARDNGIDSESFQSDQIDYGLMAGEDKGPVLGAHVIFADEDSLAYYRSAVRMFRIRGYRYIRREKNKTVLEKRGRLTIRVTIAKKTEGAWRLGDEAALDSRLKIVMIRGHNGVQGKVFSGKGTKITPGTHVILSLCRGMYEASRYRFKYPGTLWIAAESGVNGVMANAVMISLIDGMRVKKPTYSSIRAEAMRLSPATAGFVYPNDPAFVIGSMLRQRQN
jgi:hypothetical protein